MYDLIIIGGGITGQTAAIYAARKRMNFLLVTKEMGGQFLESGDVLNYPGIVRTTGAAFSALMEEQLKFNGVEPREGEEAMRLEKIPGGFRVHCTGGALEARTVIVATGARARKLGVPGEDRLARKALNLHRADGFIVHNILRGERTAGLPGNRPKRDNAVFRRQFRIGHVHHDDARCEPD